MFWWDFLVCVRQVSHSWSPTCYTIKADLELLALLVPHTECWDYRCVCATEHSRYHRYSI